MIPEPGEKVGPYNDRLRRSGMAHLIASAELSYAFGTVGLRPRGSELLLRCRPRHRAVSDRDDHGREFRLPAFERPFRPPFPIRGSRR